MKTTAELKWKLFNPNVLKYFKGKEVIKF